MAETPEILIAGKVIGDVLKPFTPEAELTVQYGSEAVSNGCEIKPLEAKNRPHLQVTSHNPHPDDLYTLIMVDPDAPNPTHPTLREWLHWIVVDIPQGMDASKGRTLVEYMGPQLSTGKHRYVFALYKQKGPLVKPRPLPRNTPGAISIPAILLPIMTSDSRLLPSSLTPGKKLTQLTTFDRITC